MKKLKKVWHKVRLAVDPGYRKHWYYGPHERAQDIKNLLEKEWV